MGRICWQAFLFAREIFYESGEISGERFGTEMAVVLRTLDYRSL
jgi:hypothetical protein